MIFFTRTFDFLPQNGCLLVVYGLTRQGIDPNLSNFTQKLLLITAKSQDLPTFCRMLHHLHTNKSACKYVYACVLLCMLQKQLLTSLRNPKYLCHVYRTSSQRLVTQNCPVFVPLPPLKQDLQLISLAFQKMRVLLTYKHVHTRETGKTSNSIS